MYVMHVLGAMALGIAKVKKAVRENLLAHKHYNSQNVSDDTMHEINPIMLVDPLVNGKRKECFLEGGHLQL